MAEKRRFGHRDDSNHHGFRRHYKGPKSDAFRPYRNAHGTFAPQIRKRWPEKRRFEYRDDRSRGFSTHDKCPKIDAFPPHRSVRDTFPHPICKRQLEKRRYEHSNPIAESSSEPKMIEPIVNQRVLEFRENSPRCESHSIDRNIVSREKSKSVFLEKQEQDFTKENSRSLGAKASDNCLRNLLVNSKTMNTKPSEVWEEDKFASVEGNYALVEKIDVSSNLKTSTQPRLLATKYPGVHVFREFLPDCRRVNSPSEPEVCASPIAVNSPESEMMEINVNQGVPVFREPEVSNPSPIEEESPTLQAIESNMSGIRGESYEGPCLQNLPKEWEVKVQNELGRVMGHEIFRQVRDGASIECDVKEREDIVEMRVRIPTLNGNLLQLDFQCQVVSNEVFGGKNSPKCELSEALENHSTDLSRAPFDKSKSVSLKELEQNSTMEDSLLFGAKDDEQCSSQLLGDCEKRDFALNDSTNPSIVPFDDDQVVINRNKVRKALSLFHQIYDYLLEEHRSKSKEHEESHRQIHIEAAMVLKRQHRWVNGDERFFGHVPGVEIGDQFRFRIELCIVGLHHQRLGGIDYMNTGEKIFATSIVDSGRYDNDGENPEVLIYSGQGGNPSVGHKDLEDQKLERGNLALKHSMDEKKHVRVIRSRQTPKVFDVISRKSDKFEKMYVYDGLYIVTKFWQKRGPYGKLVFMFQLNRIPGQPKVLQKIVEGSTRSRVSRGICVSDISEGKEKMPIRAINTIDDEIPPKFCYMTNMIYGDLHNHRTSSGCDCTDGCIDVEKCSCIRKNGGEIPFNNSGALMRAKPIVYECGPFCNCPPSCKNRVSQNGIRYQLEIFKTEKKGWGVRSRNYISSGSFICEYMGELLSDKEAEQRIGRDEYLFDIGKDDSGNFSLDENGNGFTIDALRHGSVGRFINHSCSPNLYAQNVLYDHDDKRLAHIMFFAISHIPPLRELTFDYHYKVDQVCDVRGNVKRKNCYCGSRECSGWMY